MIVTLSNKEKVHLAEKWTHKAERAFRLAILKNSTTSEDPKTGEERRTFPPENFYLAYEAVMPIVIVRIEGETGDREYSDVWRDELEEKDYQKLSKAIDELGKRDPESQKKS